MVNLSQQIAYILSYGCKILDNIWCPFDEGPLQQTSVEVHEWTPRGDVETTREYRRFFSRLTRRN